jgi:hypothetical protein
VDLLERYIFGRIVPDVVILEFQGRGLDDQADGEEQGAAIMSKSLQSRLSERPYLKARNPPYQLLSLRFDSEPLGCVHGDFAAGEGNLTVVGRRPVLGRSGGLHGDFAAGGSRWGRLSHPALLLI